MSFRSQGDQREHSNEADRYLFPSDLILLLLNKKVFISESNETKILGFKKKKKKDIHLQVFCKLFLVSKTEAVKTLRWLFRAK